MRLHQVFSGTLQPDEVERYEDLLLDFWQTCKESKLFYQTKKEKWSSYRLKQLCLYGLLRRHLAGKEWVWCLSPQGLRHVKGIQLDRGLEPDF